MTFDWNSSSEFENGHHRSNVTPIIGGFMLRFMAPRKNVCGHDNAWKAQPIRTKFSQMIFDWNNSAKFENGHHRSHVTPLIGGFCPPPPPENSNDNSWKAQPIQTKFSHMTFDWNSSAKFENGYRRSHVTPPNRGLLPPRKFKYFRFW